MRRIGMLFLSVFSVVLGTAQSSLAFSVAVFGDNSIDDFVNTQSGFSATLVTDAQLATAGFLDAFDAFIYTRDGASFGTGLSAPAAANVKSFVTGNVVLFMTDLADKIGAGAPQGEDPLANKALLNSLSFATKNGKGFIGEFNGAGFALSQNTSGFSGQSLELVPGTFTGLGNNITQPFNIVQSTHPVTAGLPNPWTSSGGQDFLASSTGVPSELIVAKGPAGAADQFPTIVASRSEPVPEPLTMSGTALAAGMGWLMKRKLTQSQKAKV